MKVTFYGVRGGYPSSGARFAGVGTHTTCVRFDAGGHVIVVDAGTGFASFGKDLLLETSKARRATIVLLLTHGHHDHLAGLPYCRAAYMPGTTVHVVAPPALGAERAVRHMFEPPWFPVRFDELPSQWTFRELREHEVLELPPPGEGWAPVVARRDAAGSARGAGRGRRAPVVVRTLRYLNHPRDGVAVYRIEHGGVSVVMATDVEGSVGGDVRLRRFAAGADLLIHDAQYSEERYLSIPAQGFGHSTPRMAGELARAAGVGRLLLTHHSPEADDAEVAIRVAEARESFASTDAALEGAVVDLALPRRRSSAGRQR
jgi:ribonuclease BN (tRNA processing enzyme)